MKRILKIFTVPHVRLKSHLITFLVIALLVIQIIQPSNVWKMLLAGLGLLVLVSFLWVRSLARNLSFQREMRFGWARVGDQLEERFTLFNDNWIPASWVEVIDHSNMPGYMASQVRGVEGYSKNQWRTRGQCNRRGLFTLGPTSLRTGDPFGIFEVELHNVSSSTMMVMPPIIELPSIEVAPGGRSGEGRPRSNAPDRTVSVSNTREYAPGDSLHLIHWRTTARRGTPFVRVFDGTPSGDWWIVLDLDGGVQVGQDWDSTVEHGVILAASMADRGLRLCRAVGLVANSQSLTWLSPREGDHQRWEILRALTLVNPGENTLAELLDRTRPSIGRRSSLIVITPNPDPSWIQALIPLLWRGVVPTVLMLDTSTWYASQVDESTPGEKWLLLQAQQKARQQTGQSMDMLAGLGVSRYLIPRDLLDRTDIRPGQGGQWEWKVTPQGRAIPIRKPADTAWKTVT